MPQLFADIALPIPIADSFDYLAGQFTREQLIAGARVRVTFGNRSCIGVVLGVKEQSDIAPNKLKSIDELIDINPVVSPAMLVFLKRIAGYYHHPLGEVIFAAIPVLLRKGNLRDEAMVSIWRLRQDDNEKAEAALSRAPKQQAIYRILQQHVEGIDADAMNEKSSGWRPVMRKLMAKELVEKVHALPSSGAEHSYPEAINSVVLNEQQAAVWAALNQKLDSFATHLLKGITGSGKTEVYLQCIEHVLAMGKSCLVIVPEISLTPQLVTRFKHRFPDKRIFDIHSGLSDKQRLQSWVLTEAGKVDVMVGTRSALFSPFTSLGLIIVDEEHDASFKQQEGFRYHARDMAIMRAKMDDIPIILGSATPSLESLHNVSQGNFLLHELNQRAGDAQLPDFQIVDCRRQGSQGGLSVPLRNAMRDHLAKGQQVLLFLNRRGFAPLLMCDDCGHKFDCPRCDSFLTYHEGLNKLRCHHCDYRAPAPTSCPVCKSELLVKIGWGTEQIEKEVKNSFPDESILRIDRDTTRARDALNQHLQALRDGEYSIVIGTQMLSKGHDVPNITLVGVIDADQGLFSTDFRAPERLVQQVLQVGGRAGRGAHRGKVIVQTRQPEHPLIKALQSGDYDIAIKEHLAEREEALWPPFSYVALWRASAIKREHAEHFLISLRHRLNAQHQDLLVFPVVPASMERRGGRYHFQLLMRATTRRLLHQTVQGIQRDMSSIDGINRVRWSLDIDPVDLV